MMAMIGKMKTIDQSKSIRAICHHLNGFHAGIHQSKKPTIKDSKFQNEIVEHVGGW
jgi:hypothetical protein